MSLFNSRDAIGGAIDNARTRKAEKEAERDREKRDLPNLRAAGYQQDTHSKSSPRMQQLENALEHVLGEVQSLRAAQRQQGAVLAEHGTRLNAQDDFNAGTRERVGQLQKSAADNPVRLVELSTRCVSETDSDWGTQCGLHGRRCKRKNFRTNQQTGEKYARPE